MTLEETKAYIKAHYGTMTPNEIGRELGRSPDRVRQIARRMGLYKYTKPRKRTMAKCKGCMLNADGICIYHLEAEANRCRGMRFTKAKFPTDGRNK